MKIFEGKEAELGVTYHMTYKKKKLIEQIKNIIFQYNNTFYLDPIVRLNGRAAYPRAARFLLLQKGNLYNLFQLNFSIS